MGGGLGAAGTGTGDTMAENLALLLKEQVTRSILVVRNHRVMLDADLAKIYGATTKRLNEQVKRNRERFPPDFMFRLNAAEKAKVVANCDHLSKLKFSPVLPFAFTEHGAIMAATVGSPSGRDHFPAGWGRGSARDRYSLGQMEGMQ